MAGANGATNGDSIVIQVLGAVAAGVGVLGFVAAYGGGVVYTRAKAAGVPPDEAMGVVPRESLIAIGATFLIPAAGLALAAVLALFLIVAYLGWRDKNEKEKEVGDPEDLVDDAVRLEAEAIDREEKATVPLREAQEARAVAAGASDPDVSWAKEAFTTAADRSTDARKLLDEAADLRSEARIMRKAAVERTGQGEMITAQQRLRRLWTITATLFVTQIAIIFFWDPVEGRQWLAILGVGAVGAAASGAVYARSDSFLQFAVAAFLAIGILLGVTDYDRLRNSPKIEPAAALRKDGVALTGYFVAETDSRVYLGLPQQQPHEKSHIIEIPRDNLAILRVGRLVDTDAALGRAIAFGQDLCRDHEQVQKNSAGSQKKPPARCTVR